ncbi:MAG TPA: hypothetical protein VMR70_06200 [Flavisolibacter sp.]|nr:hypothetical protein [Flavisolibacter sp.]
MFIKFLISIFLLLSCQLQDKVLSKTESEVENMNCLLKTGWYLVDYTRSCERKLVNDTTTYFLREVPLITSRNVIAVEDMKFMDETPGLFISFDPNGTKQWEKITGSHVGELFAFVLNDTLLTVGLNTAKISTGKAFFPLYNRSSAELQRIKKAIMTK